MINRNPVKSVSPWSVTSGDTISVKHLDPKTVETVEVVGMSVVITYTDGSRDQFGTSDRVWREV